MLEKRRYQRLEIDLPVILRYDGRLLPATILNISCGGVCLRASETAFLNKAPVEIIFDLNEKQRDISMSGTITRVDPSPDAANVGIQFTNLFSLSYKTIQEYLGKNLN